MKDLSLQLFSARNTDLKTSLKIIAEAGYKSVEGYGANFDDPDAFQNELKANGLVLASCHVGLDELESNLSSQMELLTRFGTTHVVCPYLLPEHRPTDKTGWVALATRLAAINDTLQSNGFTFAWHNHEFEFEALADGSIPMQILLDSAPTIHWEIDIGWIARAGSDAAHWLQTYSKRISAVHLKDVANNGEAQDEDGWADVGYGVVDWSNLLGDLKNSSAKHFIIEHDNPNDLKRFAQNSFNSVSAWT